MNLLARWRTILAVDADARACAVYRANIDTEVVCGRVGDTPLPAADVVTGGPPCQPYSQSGKRQGADDERDGIPEFIDAVGKVRPRMFLMEQVPGFASLDGGAVMHRTVRALEALGYGVDMRQLDAVSFGVPQFRERLWFWGVRRDLDIVRRWPVPTHMDPKLRGDLFGADLPPWVTVGEALGLENGTTGAREFAGSDEPSSSLTATRAGEHCVLHRPRGASVVRRDHPVDEPCPTLTHGASGSGAVLRIIGGGSNPRAPGDARTERDITDEPSTTIGCIAGNALPYRWSDAMLAKHPPAVPGEPCPTILGKSYKGGAEGLLSVDGRPWESRHPVAEPDAPAPTVRPRSPRDGGRCVENVVRVYPGHTGNEPTAPAKTLKAGAHGVPGGENAVWLPSPTINTGVKSSGGPEPINHRHSRGWCRRLTPDECARLMSMPDDFRWPEGTTKTARYMVIGNGWASLMAKRMSEALAMADPESRTVVDLFCGGGVGAVGWHGRAWEAARAGAEAVA